MIDTEPRVRSILVAHLGMEGVETNARLHDDLGVDSLDLVELEMCFEEEFQIDFDTDPGKGLMPEMTVGEVVAFVDKLRPQN